MLKCANNFSTGHGTKACDVCKVIDDEDQRINRCRKWDRINLWMWWYLSWWLWTMPSSCWKNTIYVGLRKRQKWNAATTVIPKWYSNVVIEYVVVSRRNIRNYLLEFIRIYYTPMGLVTPTQARGPWQDLYQDPWKRHRYVAILVLISSETTLSETLTTLGNLWQSLGSLGNPRNPWQVLATFGDAW